MHSDTTSRPKAYCPVIDLRIITSIHMSKIFRGLDSTVTPQVHLPLTQTFSHAHLLQPGVWLIKCQILGSKTFHAEDWKPAISDWRTKLTHTPPFWRHSHNRPPSATAAGSITGQLLTHGLYAVHSSTATAGSTLLAAIHAGDTVHYRNTGEADPGGRAV